MQQTWLLQADTFGPEITEWMVGGTFLLPLYYHVGFIAVVGHPRRIRSWRAGADNNPFRLLGRIAMAIQRIPQLVSHE
ncbi:MAG: hypothetical protein CM15mP74_28010 [Halieaceae bacterium]|nr:MAG: hypothetical protein CM15mP74_28010 [Halieaceae bacterium]